MAKPCPPSSPGEIPMAEKISRRKREYMSRLTFYWEDAKDEPYEPPAIDIIDYDRYKVNETSRKDKGD